MKTIVTCASIAAVGATGLQAQELRDPEPQKPWSVAATVRGFYDDNYTTAPNNQTLPGVRDKRASWGVNVNPYFNVELLQDLTTIRFMYEWDGRYYADRSAVGDNQQWDNTHQVKLGVNHEFCERYDIEVYDSFVVSQRPDVLAPAGAQLAEFTRTLGNNIRNYGGAAFNGLWTERIGSRIEYSNTFYDYEQDTINPAAGVFTSRSALLDRMEHRATLDVRKQFQPTTVGLFGYRFQYVDQNSNSPLGFDVTSGSAIMPSVRNRSSHFFFFGSDHTFNEQHSITGRLGVEYANYPNATAGMKDNRWLPYVDVMYQFLMTDKSRFQFGVKNEMTQTDIAYATLGSAAGTGPTQDAQSTSVYANVSYDITARLTAMGRGYLQFSKWNGGVLNGQLDSWYTADINFNYEINRYLDAELGYAYDRLDSVLGIRRYSRNRVYFGFRATY